MDMGQRTNRKDNGRDNSPSERIFRHLKHGQLNHEKVKTQEAAKLSAIDYVAFCNGRPAILNFRPSTPFEFELDFLDTLSE